MGSLHHNAGLLDQESLGLISRYQFVRQNLLRFLLIIEIVTIAIYLLILSLVDPQSSTKVIPEFGLVTETCFPSEGKAGSVRLGYLALTSSLRVFIGAWLFFKSRVVVDTIGLKKELWIALLASTALPMLIQVALKRVLSAEAKLYANALIALSIYACSILSPLYQAKKNQNLNRIMNEFVTTRGSDAQVFVEYCPLEHYLMTSEGRHLFSKFLGERLHYTIIYQSQYCIQWFHIHNHFTESLHNQLTTSSCDLASLISFGMEY